MECLDSRCMAENKELWVTQMRRMLHILVEAKHVNGAVCDYILREFRVLAALQGKLREIDPKTARVDILLYETKTIIFPIVGCGEDSSCFITWAGKR